MIFRIKFAKFGVVRFIGHLDVMRYFQKVIRRSELPVCYSQGFSPHQLMSFALPLGVGVTSDGEYMEVEFDEEKLAKVAGCSGADPDGSMSKRKTEQTVLEYMNRHITDGFEILRVRALDRPKPNTHQDKAMALVSAADYCIRVRDGYDVGFATQAEFYSAFRDFAGQEEIVVTKKTKKNETQLNIREHIYGFGSSAEDTDVQVIFSEDPKIFFPAGGLTHSRHFENGKQLLLRLAAGSKMNIKPELVLEAFMSCNGREFDKNAFVIHRMELYYTDKDKLIPLI